MAQLPWRRLSAEIEAVESPAARNAHPLLAKPRALQAPLSDSTYAEGILKEKRKWFVVSSFRFLGSGFSVLRSKIIFTEEKPETRKLETRN
jgi:hypothetical protein